jgi:hypothetical protein
MELTIGRIYHYDGKDDSTDLESGNVELVMTTAFGFEGEVLIRSLESGRTQMVSEIHLSESKDVDPSLQDSLQELVEMFEEEKTTNKGDIKMAYQELKAGDVVIMTEVSPADEFMVGLRVGDRVTVLAGVGEVIPSHDILSDNVIGSTNDDDVAIGVTDRGTPALLGDDNSFKKE